MRGKKFKVWVYCIAMILLAIIEVIFTTGWTPDRLANLEGADIPAVFMGIGLLVIVAFVMISIATAAVSVVLLIGYGIFRFLMINYNEITSEQFDAKNLKFDESSKDKNSMTSILFGIAIAMVISSPLYYLVYCIVRMFVLRR